MLHVLAFHDCILVLSGLPVSTRSLPVVDAACTAAVLCPGLAGWAGAPALSVGLCLHGLVSPVKSRQGWKPEEGIPSLFSLQPQRGGRSAPQGEPAPPRLSSAPGLRNQLKCLFIYFALFMYLLIYFDLNGSFSVLPILGSRTSSCVVLDVGV